MNENAFIKTVETKLDSFAENQAYSGWSYSMLFWGYDSNNLKKHEKCIFDSVFSKTVSQICSLSEVSEVSVEGISGLFNTPLITLSILFAFSSSIG